MEIYDRGTLGQGVRVRRHIPFDADVLKHSIAALLDGRPLTFLEVEAKRNVAYVINTSLSEETPRLLVLERHWTGMINHAPPRSCNMRFEGLTLVQVKKIHARESLLVDYGCSHWVHQITDVDYSHWKVMGDDELLEAFGRMHAAPSSPPSSPSSSSPAPAVSPETRRMRRHWARYVASMAGQPTLPERFPDIFDRFNTTSSSARASVALSSPA